MYYRLINVSKLEWSFLLLVLYIQKCLFFTIFNASDTLLVLHQNGLRNQRLNPKTLEKGSVYTSLS